MTKVLRRFNYTNRVRIFKGNIHIDISVNEEGIAAVVRRLDLSDSGGHIEAIWNIADVFLEARRTTTETWARVSLGSVASLKAATLPKNVALSGFTDDQGITFRIKVVGADSCLLADADDIYPGKPDDSKREPLIHLIPTDLGEELWRVHIDEVDGPKVLINKKLPHCSGLLTRDPLIRGLVMPQILREVLPKLAARPQQSDDWVLRWTEFAKAIGGGEPPELESDDQERDEWVDGVVSIFTKTQRFASLAEDFLTKADSE